MQANSDSWHGIAEEVNASVSAISPLHGEPHPVIMVVGLPRSGTTLAMQILQAHGVLVPDHVVAAFWRSPAVGFGLSAHLRTVSGHHEPTYSSDYGRTDDWREPHEFSYFWRDALGCNPHSEDEVRQADVSPLASSITALSKAAGAAVAIKSFPALWMGESLDRLPEHVMFLTVTRDLEDVRKSIERGWRRAIEGGADWFSLRPSGGAANRFASTDECIDFQVDRLARSLESFNKAAASSRIVVPVDYRELVDTPEAVVASVRRASDRFVA